MDHNVGSLYILSKLLTKHFKLFSIAIVCNISLDRLVICGSSLCRCSPQRRRRRGCWLVPTTMQHFNFELCPFTLRTRRGKMTAKFLLALLCYNFTFLAIIKGALTSMVSKTIQLLILILTTLQVYSKKMKTVLKNQQFSSMHK